MEGIRRGKGHHPGRIIAMLAAMKHGLLIALS